MEYQQIAPNEKEKIKRFVFSKTEPLHSKVIYLLSSVYHHETEFFVEVYRKIFTGNDPKLQLEAIKIVPEYMQSHGTVLGADIFISTIMKFIDQHPNDASETQEILSEALEFRAIFSENRSH